MLELAKARGVPVLRSKLKTAEFYRRIKPIVEEAFAPRTTLHGSLADVYGVGLLFVGRSGIGKSECVLDLVERGHRLVADDVVQVTRRGNDVLIGRGHELAAHHMEIRGIGLIDIPALFGVRAVRQQKRIEVVVQLEDWENAKDTDRTGLGAGGDHHSRRAGPPGRGAAQSRQEHHRDLRSGGHDAPPPLLGCGRGRGVQRPAHQADEGAARACANTSRKTMSEAAAGRGGLPWAAGRRAGRGGRGNQRGRTARWCRSPTSACDREALEDRVVAGGRRPAVGGVRGHGERLLPLRRAQAAARPRRRSRWLPGSTSPCWWISSSTARSRRRMPPSGPPRRGGASIQVP